MNWFIAALKKYATFSGRARRKEYWFFTLFYIIFYIALSAVDTVITLGSNAETISFLTLIYSLALFLPTLSVCVRRLHDTDRTGWWILIGLIPLIGSIVLLIFLVQDSQPDSNQYGENPKLETL